MLCKTRFALLGVSVSLAAAAPASAHVVVESDFRGPLPVGSSGRLATLTLINEDPEGPSFTVCNLGECGSSEGITLVPACATQDAGGRCTTIDPGLFSIGPTATGGASTACSGTQFMVTEISPGKLSFNPAATGQHIVLPPLSRCRIEFSLTVLKAATTDARPGLEGLQTDQVSEILSTVDLQAGTPTADLGSNTVTFDIPPPAPPRATTPLTAAPVVDTTGPVLSALSLSPASFRSAAGGRAITAVPVGTTVGYGLSEPAEVKFQVERAEAGRLVGRRCVKPTRANRAARRCRRYLRLRGSFKHAGRAGSNSFKFRGRLDGRRLAPGRYRLSAVASDARGNSSSRVRKRFRIVKR